MVCGVGIVDAVEVVVVGGGVGVVSGVTTTALGAATATASGRGTDLVSPTGNNKPPTTTNAIPVVFQTRHFRVVTSLRWVIETTNLPQDNPHLLCHHNASGT